MKRSSDRIRTTHAGRLPVSPGLENLPVRLYLGEVVDPAVIAEGIAHGIRKQVDLGIDCIGDGEFWKVRNFTYLSRHFTGIETRPLKPGEPASTRVFTRERDEFVQFYKDLDATGTIFHVPGEKPKYVGGEASPSAARNLRNEAMAPAGAHPEVTSANSSVAAFQVSAGSRRPPPAGGATGTTAFMGVPLISTKRRSTRYPTFVRQATKKRLLVWEYAIAAPVSHQLPPKAPSEIC